jgi:hypothetical protein
MRRFKRGGTRASSHLAPSPARPRESGDPEPKKRKNWIPAFAGMSGVCCSRPHTKKDAKAPPPVSERARVALYRSRPAFALRASADASPGEAMERREAPEACEAPWPALAIGPVRAPRASLRVTAASSVCRGGVANPATGRARPAAAVCEADRPDAAPPGAPPRSERHVCRSGRRAALLRGPRDQMAEDRNIVKIGEQLTASSLRAKRSNPAILTIAGLLRRWRSSQ